MKIQEEDRVNANPTRNSTIFKKSRGEMNSGKNEGIKMR